MSLFLKLRRALAEPRLAGIDPDGEERIAVHLQIMQEKPMLQQVFQEFYRQCRQLDEHYLSGEGQRIELGSGVGLIKIYYPDVLLSDVVPAVHLDMVLDAQNMELTDASTRAFYGINCFHHFSDPDQFFQELERVLVPGGGCILIEPYYGPGAAAFFKRLFDTEDFDKTQKEWRYEEEQEAGAMTGANQALSYIVFRRDVDQFHAQYPDLEIVYQRRFNNYLRYLFSGGLNFRQLLPSWSTPLVRLVERILMPFDHLWALHHVIVLRKKVTPVAPRSTSDNVSATLSV